MFKIAIIANLATQSVLAQSKAGSQAGGWSPSVPNYRAEKPQRPSFNTDRPQFDGYEAKRPEYSGYNPERPEFNGMKAERPEFDSYKPSRPQFDGQAVNRPAFDGFKAPRPQYDSQKPSRPQYDSFKPDRPAFDSYKPSRPAHDDYTAQRPERPDINVPTRGHFASHRPAKDAPAEDAPAKEVPMEAEPTAVEEDAPANVESGHPHPQCHGYACYNSRNFVPRRYVTAAHPRRSWVGPSRTSYRHGFSRGNRREYTPVHRMMRGPGPRYNGLQPKFGSPRSTYNGRAPPRARFGSRGPRYTSRMFGPDAPRFGPRGHRFQGPSPSQIDAAPLPSYGPPRGYGFRPKKEESDATSNESTALFDSKALFGHKKEVKPTVEEIEEILDARCEFEHCDVVEPLADGFEAERYMGKWYQVMHTKTSPWQTSATCTRAVYSDVDEFGSFSVFNSKRSATGGPPLTAAGNAKCPAEKGAGQCFITFNHQPYSECSNYQIVETDYDNFSIVHSCGHGFQHVFILSRMPYLADALEQQVLTTVKNKLPSYNVHQLAKDDQSHMSCGY